MLKELLKNTKFKSEVNEFYNKNKDNIIDIILFGSSARGKEKPNDVDILLLFKKGKDIDLSYSLKKKLEKFGYNTEIINKNYKELFDELFPARESILSEGYSLIFGKFLSNGLGYTNFVLFRYELKGFSKSDRMRFYYSLYGRNGQKGILKELKAIKFSETILLCTMQNSEKMSEYLKNWKINFIEFPILIPARLKLVL